MPQSIFDWDEDEVEEKPQEPVALIPYEPDLLELGREPIEYRSDPIQPGPEPDDADPVPFEYHSDPFQTQPLYGGSEQYGLGQQPEQPDHSPDPAADDYDPFGYETSTFSPPPVEYQPPSAEETARSSGLAFSAGIVFFSSVVFMLFLGWIADWLIGSSPWGLVGGIVLGSIIGLIQFVRITSQIFNSKKSEAAIHPLMPPDDER
jgi:F0F1-type ATP synthase assembly protein I